MCKADAPVRIQSALSQGHPKAAGRQWNLGKQVPFLMSICWARSKIKAMVGGTVQQTESLSFLSA